MKFGRRSYSWKVSDYKKWNRWKRRYNSTGTKSASWPNWILSDVYPIAPRRTARVRERETLLGSSQIQTSDRVYSVNFRGDFDIVKLIHFVSLPLGFYPETVDSSRLNLDFGDGREWIRFPGEDNRVRPRLCPSCNYAPLEANQALRSLNFCSRFDSLSRSSVTFLPPDVN